MQSYLEKFNSDTINWIRATVEAEVDISRTQLARRFCEQFDWIAPNGSYQESGCAIALQRLEKLDLITLPPARKIPCHDPNRRQELAAYTRDDLQCTLPELGQITLIMTNGDREQTCLWRRIVNTCHSLKNSNLCGRQIRYLVESSNHGTIGALSFSSPAWRLAARDKWISWNDSSRPVQLDRIINNSRFLILPQVLAMACRQVVPDWKSMYGLDAVLLETFVDPRSYRGTSYRAAN